MESAECINNIFQSTHLREVRWRKSYGSYAASYFNPRTYVRCDPDVQPLYKLMA